MKQIHKLNAYKVKLDSVENSAGQINECQKASQIRGDENERRAGEGDVTF